MSLERIAPGGEWSHCLQKTHTPKNCVQSWVTVVRSTNELENDGALYRLEEQKTVGAISYFSELVRVMTGSNIRSSRLTIRRWSPPCSAASRFLRSTQCSTEIPFFRTMFGREIWLTILNYESLEQIRDDDNVSLEISAPPGVLNVATSTTNGLEGTVSNDTWLDMSDWNCLDSSSGLEHNIPISTSEILQSPTHCAPGFEGISIVPDRHPKDKNLNRIKLRTCFVCEPAQTFASKSVFTRHQRSKHSSERPFICSTCNPPKSFNRKDILQRHKRAKTHKD